jgi:hypothetical protein
LGGGVTVAKNSVVTGDVTVVNDVVEVTIVEVESVVTITGWCVKVMTAKNPVPPAGGLMISD